MSHWSSFIKTIFGLVSKNSPAKGKRIARFRLASGTREMRSTSAGQFLEDNAKMVLINDDQWHIADIVLDGWVFEKKNESLYCVPYSENMTFTWVPFHEG